MGLIQINKKLVIVLILTLPLALPWANALFSDFILASEFSDRKVKMIGSHGRFKLQAKYLDGTHVVSTGYYGGLFDTLYLFNVRQNKVVEGDVNNLSVFLKSHQSLIVLKISRDSENNYILKKLEEDPRLGMVETIINAEGYFGPLSSIPSTIYSTQ
ncbi:hypothetical protein [Vibrio kanaloae]|uniref:hypothetical protein n=1 Tax=Vibrio kanaloae TaxID=170673 RepID=UPI0011B50CF5|nr:hypothetical protein [Vibrio kanaloae]